MYRITAKVGIWARIISIVVVLALLAVFIHYIDSPSRRYSEYRAQCKMIFAREGRVDLAVIGSSRSMRAFQADMLEADVRDRYGYAPVIFDLSRAYRDPGHMYVFLEDLFEHHEVDMVLVEYKETGPQELHPLYEKTATIKQILGSLYSYPSKPLPGRIQATVRWILDKVSQRITEFFQGELNGECAKSKKIIKVETEDPSSPWYINSSLLKMQHEKHESGWAMEPMYYFDMHAVAEERNNFYTRKMIDLAHRQGAEIFFYYIPELYGRPLSEKFMHEFSAAFGIDLIQLSEDQLRSVYPEGYTDSTHMGWGGAKVYMRHLADVLPWETSRKNIEHE